MENLDCYILLKLTTSSKVHIFIFDVPQIYKQFIVTIFFFAQNLVTILMV